MDSEVKTCFKLLNQYRFLLTKPQVRSLKGQILAGDLNGFKTGLSRILKKRYGI